MNPTAVLKQAISLFPSAAACARACGLTRQALNNALLRERMTVEMAVAIEKGCHPLDAKGQITRDRLVWGDWKKGAT